MAFFDQNHGLTPLENAVFGTLKYFIFYGKKKFILYLEHY